MNTFEKSLGGSENMIIRARTVDGMADKTAQRAIKGTVRTVRTVKWVFYALFIWNVLPPNLFQPKWATGILRITRKNYGWA